MGKHWGKAWHAEAMKSRTLARREREKYSRPLRIRRRLVRRRLRNILAVVAVLAAALVAAAALPR